MAEGRHGAKFMPPAKLHTSCMQEGIDNGHPTSCANNVHKNICRRAWNTKLKRACIAHPPGDASVIKIVLYLQPAQ